MAAALGEVPAGLPAGLPDGLLSGASAYDRSFPGRCALRFLQALLLAILGCLVGLGTYFAWVGVMKDEFTPGEDFEACFVAAGGGRTSPRFVEIVASISINSTIFTFLAMMVADRALRHPSWLLPSIVLVSGLAVASFLSQDIKLPFPSPEQAWATQLTMWRFISLDMYDCLPFGGCEFAGAINTAWVALQLLETVLVLCLSFLLQWMHTCQYQRDIESLTIAYARVPLLGEDPMAQDEVQETSRSEENSRYVMNLVLAGGMGLAMVIELIFLADANMVQLSHLEDHVPYSIPTTTIINTTVPYPTCDPLHPITERTINVTTDDACQDNPELAFCDEIVGCTAFPFSKPGFPIQTLFIAGTLLSALRAYVSTSYSAFRLCQMCAFVVICTLVPSAVVTYQKFHLEDLWNTEACRIYLQDQKAENVLFLDPSDDDADRYCTDAKGALMASTTIIGLSVCLLLAAGCRSRQVSLLPVAAPGRQKRQEATERLINGDDSDESSESTNAIFEPESEEIA